MRRAIWLLAIGPLLASAQPHYTADQEMALGRQLAAEVERDATVIGDPAITGYVDRLARRLAAHVLLRTPLTVKLITGTDIYASTLPGGYIDVNTKAILAAANEAELAGVIAHQLGHLVLWPSMPSPAPGQIPLLFMGGRGGICMRSGASVVGLAIPMGYLTSSRETEAKSDSLALGYLETAGYDPEALTDFYGRITKPAPGTARRVFDLGLTMPETTRAQADSMRNARPFVVNTSEFEEIRRKVSELPPGQ